MTTAEERVNAVLMHHGIEGQKWGVRHGPPYPLDRKTSSKIKNGEPVTPKKRSILDLFRKPEEKKEEKEETPLDKFMDSGLFDGISPFDIPKFSGSKLKNLMSDETYKKFKKYQDYMDGIVKEAFEKGVKTEEEYSIHVDTADQYSFYKWEDFKGDPERWNKETMVYARPSNVGAWWLDLNTGSPGFNEEFGYGRFALTLLDSDKEKLQSIVDKYPESEYDWAKPKFDGNKLTGFEKKKLQHSALEYEIVDDVLEHYGVKGMKWGHHKKKKDDTKITAATKSNEETTSPNNANKPSETLTEKEIETTAKKSASDSAKAHIFELQEKTRKLANSKELSEQIKDRISERYQQKYHISEIDSANDQIIFTNSSGDFKYEAFAGSEIEKIKKVYDSLSHSALAEEKVGLYLEHHGILGMKWGVKHGPPYPLDRKTSSKIKKSGKVKIDIRNLDDEDLKRIVQRLNLEKQLKELTKEDTKKAESFLSKTLTKLRDKTADSVINMFTKSIESAGTKKLTSFLNEKLNKESKS